MDNTNLSDAKALSLLADRIRSNLNTYFDIPNSDRASVTGTVWGGQETARVFRFEVRDHSRSHFIFVKITPIFTHANPASLEYETLRFLHQRMPLAEEGCHVSRPLEFFPDLNAYAMESVGTRNFKNYLLKNNSRLRKDSSLFDLYSIISGCARWLAAFHRLTKADSPSKFDLRLYVESINEELGDDVLHYFEFHKPLFHLLGKFMDVLPLLDGKFDLPCAKWHWDFTPGHVFIDEGMISVIDILGLDGIPIFEDIGRFLAAMSAINNLPFYPLYDFKRAGESLCGKFVQQYLNRTGYDKEWFSLFTSIYKLKYLIIWFDGQCMRVDTKVHPLIGKAFTKLRLASLFERLISTAINDLIKTATSHI